MIAKEILIAFPRNGIVKVSFYLNIESKKARIKMIQSNFDSIIPETFVLCEIDGEWQFINENDEIIQKVTDLIETDLDIENQILLTTYKVIDKNLNEEDNVEGTFIRI